MSSQHISLVQSMLKDQMVEQPLCIGVTKVSVSTALPSAQLEMLARLGGR